MVGADGVSLFSSLRKEETALEIDLDWKEIALYVFSNMNELLQKKAVDKTIHA